MLMRLPLLNGTLAHIGEYAHAHTIARGFSNSSKTDVICSSFTSVVSSSQDYKNTSAKKVSSPNPLK